MDNEQSLSGLLRRLTLSRSGYLRWWKTDSTFVPSGSST